jgi:ribosomal-protein-alanine N-acetyltransferase
MLDATVPASWPPDLLDDDALRWVMGKLQAGEHDSGWSMYWIVLRDEQGGRTLIGTAGFKGNPTPDGTVELGYGIVSDRQRRGYATEAVRGQLRFAFSSPDVRRVIAETLPELESSKGVLAKCGFTFIGDGSEPGVIRYEVVRSA